MNSVEEKSRSMDEIGPYATAAGITKRNFSKDGTNLPLQPAVKNGLVLELHSYATTELSMHWLEFVNLLIKITNTSTTSTEGANERSVNTFVNRLVENQKKLKRKGKAYESSLCEFREQVFSLVRRRDLKDPDTPRKKKLRAQLAEAKAGNKGVKRKLEETQSHVTELKEVIVGQECEIRHLEEETAGKKESDKEVDRLSLSLRELQGQHENLMKEMKEMSSKFDPAAINELQEYKNKYHKSSKQLKVIEKKWEAAKARQGHLEVRNVNKKIKRRDDSIGKLLREKTKLQEVVKELQDDLATTQAQLSYRKETLEKLRNDFHQKSTTSQKLYKRVWYEKKKRQADGGVLRTPQESDVIQLEERCKYLAQRNYELAQLINLLEDEEISTFHDGRYSDSVRRTIMELLSQNVSMNKVNMVIRTVLKNLAGKYVERLPAAGTLSRLSLEANHLANIEVALAMQSSKPEDSLGNCIHGDGTTKHHRKYQNFQVSLPDGTSRTLSLTEMAHGDTEAVTRAFTEQIQTLAYTLTTIKKTQQPPETSTQVFKELITTIKATMTDQGPTMPQFNEKLQAIRAELLPDVVDNWAVLPDDAKECMLEFGSFFCKMHPLINFAEEVGKVLKVFEDITKSGKNAHTLLTSEAGVTRLVRITSKAFHHRGCDKSGVEDAFSSYLENAHNVKNHLVDYIGNRANILFEGAAALFFHLDHILSFLSMLDNKNNLLMAVEEDAGEKLFKSELRALGLFYGLVTEPLWDTVKKAENILAMNKPLHLLQLKLAEWKVDASPVLSGDSPFSNIDISSDPVCKKLLEPTDAESENMTIQALELISCAVLLILQRQCKDQLPGGKYWDPSPTVLSAFSNVPSTNLVGERDFAQLDLLIRQKPAARITTLESIIMWTNNRTPEWLDSLSEEERSEYMKVARQQSSEVLARYNDRKRKIKAEKWEALQKSQQKLRESQEKKRRSTAALVNEVTALDGLWTTVDSVDQHIKNFEKEHTEEFIRRAIHTQLSFMQKVLKCKGPSKEHFQLTHSQHTFTKSEMSKHLKEVILHNKLQPETNPQMLISSLPPDTTSGGLRYTSEEERVLSFYEQKRKLVNKIEAEKKKQSAQSSKLFMKKLLANPDLLIGINIEHLFIVDQRKMWIKGKVTGISSYKTDPIKTVYIVDYEDEEEEKHYNLLTDLSKSELIIHGKL